MIDKFLNKYQDFASRDEIENLGDEAKVALFGIYLEAIKPTPEPSVPQSRLKSHEHATFKQKNYIARLIKQGKLPDDTNIDGLSKKAASILIDKGINAQPKPKPQPEVEPDGEFTGSYSHESGGYASNSSWWE